MGRLMKKAGLIVACACLLIVGGTVVAARIHHQQEWKEAFRAALDSGERAFDYRDTGTFTYNSRLQEFETTYDALQTLGPPNEFALSKMVSLRKCLDDLKLYRTNKNIWNSIRGLERAGLSEQISDRTQEQISDSEALAKTSENCLIDLER